MLQIYDIYIVGLGIMSTLQITRETEQTLRLCKKIFFLHSEPILMQKYLESLCPDVIDLHYYYESNVAREQAYRGMVKAVIETAQQKSPVALALYGNPVVFVTPTQVIMNIAPEFGLKVKMLPGVSAFDCMLVDLGVDPSQGTMIYEVNDMLLHRRDLHPDMHCFIWQVGGVESEVFSTSISRPSRFLRLKKHLLQFYPPEHEATIITCATNPVVEAKLTKVALGKLETEPIQMHAGATLYIPPVREPEVLDEEFLKLVTTVEHLKDITDEQQNTDIGSHGSSKPTQ